MLKRLLLLAAALVLLCLPAMAEEASGFSGVTLDGATLGAEYGVYFREDNTADLILAGYTIENLPYSINEDGVYVINYYGAFFNCTPTDTGFDIDYYGTMTLHCTPAV